MPEIIEIDGLEATLDVVDDVVEVIESAEQGPPGPPGEVASGIGLTISNGVADGVIAPLRPILRSCSIVGGYLLSDAVGSVTVDVRKGSISSPATPAVSICGGAPVVMAAAQSLSIDVSAWDTDLVAGEYLQFVASGASGLSALTLALNVEAV